jgi:hypothetical protein
MLYPLGFTFNKGVEFFKSYEPLWIYALLFYLPLCQILENFYNSKYRNLYKKIGFVWNFLLSVFSAIGTYQTLPFLVKCVYNEGVKSVLNLENPKCNYMLNPSVAYWSTLFVASKIPELVDTFLYVLKNGKQHIFLHWYHHLFTAFYSYWMTVKDDGPSRLGIWMISLNFFVHAFMYAYYAVMEITERDCWVRKLVMSYSSFITTVQTGQMFIMIYVFLYDKFALGNELDHFGIGMYLVYAVLFSNLFIKKYISKIKKQ